MAGDGGRVPDVSEQRAATFKVAVCDQYLPDLLIGRRGEVLPGSSLDRAEPGCGAQCSRNYRERWSCPTHGDAITVDWVSAVALSDPASVLAALLAESPEATVAAIEALLTSDEAFQASATAVAAEYYGGWAYGFTATEAASVALSAACRSLLSKAPKGDSDA